MTYRNKIYKFSLKGKIEDMNEAGKESFLSSEGFWDFVFGILFIAIAVYLYSILQQTTSGIPSRIPVFDLVLIVLALYRLTHLVTQDKITNPIRQYFSKFERGVRKTIYELLICPWCVGIWLSLFLVFLYLISPLAWFFILILAISALAIILRTIVHKFSH